MELWSCNQDPFVIRADIARIFGLPLHGICLFTAMFEELHYDGAMPENATPRSYRVAHAADLPAEFKTFVAEHGLGRGLNGLKSIGEAGMLTIAVADATGV